MTDIIEFPIERKPEEWEDLKAALRSCGNGQGRMASGCCAHRGCLDDGHVVGFEATGTLGQRRVPGW